MQQIRCCRLVAFRPSALLSLWLQKRMLSRGKFDRGEPNRARRNEVTLEIPAEVFSDGVIEGLVKGLLVPLVVDNVIRESLAVTILA
jgi:hypothetical protein